MSNQTRRKTPLSVLTRVKKDSKYPAKALPELEMNIFFDLDQMEEMCKKAREYGHAILNWNVSTPQIRICLETVDRAQKGVMNTDYMKAAANQDESHEVLHLTLL